MFYTMHLPGTVWSHDCAIECAFYVLLPRHHCKSTDNLQHCLTFSWASSRILLKAEASNSTRTSRNKCFLGVTRRKTPTIRKANGREIHRWVSIPQARNDRFWSSTNYTSFAVSSSCTFPWYHLSHRGCRKFARLSRSAELGPVSVNSVNSGRDLSGVSDVYPVYRPDRKI